MLEILDSPYIKKKTIEKRNIPVLGTGRGADAVARQLRNSASSRAQTNHGIRFKGLSSK